MFVFFPRYSNRVADFKVLIDDYVLSDHFPILAYISVEHATPSSRQHNSSTENIEEKEYRQEDCSKTLDALR
ncbi:hypothetical protein BpHYR1_031827 [Brachionus plicatilis]|uniref:RNA-directed DNA polymerase from mobile element jockey-like n=1 Tax=Brachionus plicatilis TaxID=10195 RepID=A0A3M7SY28_BRAPC|nr:hypothetical protein BpHYR1_031827 [Brachionus plicatilis]